MADLKSAGLLLFCTAGIYGAYLTQGIVSEQLQVGGGVVHTVYYTGLQHTQPWGCAGCGGMWEAAGARAAIYGAYVSR